MTGTDKCIMSETCADKPADHGMMCEDHRKEDRLIGALVTDECTCVSCRSDCAGIVPCEREATDGHG